MELFVNIQYWNNGIILYFYNLKIYENILKKLLNIIECGRQVYLSTDGKHRNKCI